MIPAELIGQMSDEASWRSLAHTAELVARLHERAAAARWQLSVERFGAALARSAERRFRPSRLDEVSPRDLEAYLESLHLEDLALACACADGVEAAWDAFMRDVRPGLLAAARAIAGPDHGPELADTLYADLYGLAERDGRRRSLFDYFHGRSKLSTWLRSVLAQRHVDQARAARRTVSLDEERGDAGETMLDRLAAPDATPEPDRPRLSRVFAAATAAALAALRPADRLRLSYYYRQGLTLAQIGRLMGEHESSASRKLERIRRHVRKGIERRLSDEGLDQQDVRQCVQWFGENP